MMKEDFRRTVNIGNPGDSPSLELAKIVVEMTGSLVADHPPSGRRENDPKQRRANIDLAKRPLGKIWEPKILLRTWRRSRIFRGVAHPSRGGFADKIRPYQSTGVFSTLLLSVRRWGGGRDEITDLVFRDGISPV